MFCFFVSGETEPDFQRFFDRERILFNRNFAARFYSANCLFRKILLRLRQTFTAVFQTFKAFKKDKFYEELTLW